MQQSRKIGRFGSRTKSRASVLSPCRAPPWVGGRRGKKEKPVSAPLVHGENFYQRLRPEPSSDVLYNLSAMFACHRAGRGSHHTKVMVGVQRWSIVLVRPSSLNPSPVRIRANAKELSCVPDENFPRLSRGKSLCCVMDSGLTSWRCVVAKLTRAMGRAFVELKDIPIQHIHTFFPRL
jgi:hypothetical protein